MSIRWKQVTAVGTPATAMPLQNDGIGLSPGLWTNGNPLVVHPFDNVYLGQNAHATPQSWSAANRAVYIPVTLQRRMIIDRIGFAAASSANDIDLGILDESGELLVSTGQFTPSSSVRPYDITRTPLEAGRYWIAVSCDGTSLTYYVNKGPIASLMLGLKYESNACPLPSQASFSDPAGTDINGFPVAFLMAEES